MLANVHECILVDLLVNRNKETVTAYLMRLPQRKWVMDMWHRYKDAVQAALPHATIVIDKCMSSKW